MMVIVVVVAVALAVAVLVATWVAMGVSCTYCARRQWSCLPGSVYTVVLILLSTPGGSCTVKYTPSTPSLTQRPLAHRE
ncbi:hypothetical protein C2E23DRAFT_805188 [Lenzites betulinus]|nr:hypothetical protein C2E23DRAFT_847478 [Lenzites betulinus]KAH9857649.1 hypothetical protein C2E23DRAFT_805188 [Lenzites betulinus]